MRPPGAIPQDYINDPEFEVEEILDKRLFGGNIQYKVKWMGYSLDAATWEPMQGLNKCYGTLAKFEATFHGRMLERIDELERIIENNKKQIIELIEKQSNDRKLPPIDGVGIKQVPPKVLPSPKEDRKREHVEKYTNGHQSHLRNGKERKHKKSDENEQKSQFKGVKIKNIKKNKSSSKKKIKHLLLSPLAPKSPPRKKKSLETSADSESHYAEKKKSSKSKDRANLQYSADDEAEQNPVEPSSSKDHKKSSRKDKEKSKPQFPGVRMKYSLNTNTSSKNKLGDTKASPPGVSEKRNLERRNKKDKDHAKKRKDEKSRRKMRQPEEKKDSDKKGSRNKEGTPPFDTESELDREFMDMLFGAEETVEEEVGDSSQDPEEMVLHQFY